MFTFKRLVSNVAQECDYVNANYGVAGLKMNIK